MNTDQIIRECLHKQVGYYKGGKAEEDRFKRSPESMIPEVVVAILDGASQKIEDSWRGISPACTYALGKEGWNPQALAWIGLSAIVSKTGADSEPSFQSVAGAIGKQIGLGLYDNVKLEGEWVKEVVLPAIKPELNQCQRLVSDILASTNLFTTVVSGGITCITLSEEGHKLIDKRILKAARDSFEYRPMICKPRDWTEDGGGYLSVDIPFVKEGDWKVEQGEHGDMSLAMAACNKLQAVPYRVNEKLLELLPETGYRPEDVIKIAKKGRRHRRTERLQRKEAMKTIGIAADSAGMPLYFPCNIDFRGRIYYLPVGLKPEGSDIGKALLEFEECCVIETQEQAKWLKIHYANEFHMDKIPLNERVEWADSQDIMASEWDTYTQLAAMLELNACMEALEAGEAYESRLPVALDYTCQGYQIISSLLRDKSCAELVNTLPDSKVNCVYLAVAKAAGDDIERGMAKACVMPDGYGATMSGKTAGVDKLDGHDLTFKECYAIATRIEAGIEIVCPSVSLFKAHIAAEAKAAKLLGEAYTYTLPSGFKLNALYKKVKTKAINAGGYKLRYKEQAEGLGKENVTSASANTVHAIDANILQEIVTRTEWPVVAIHDSVATLAKGCDDLHEKSIESFVDVLEQCTYTGERVDTLNLSDCRQAKYMLS